MGMFFKIYSYTWLWIRWAYNPRIKILCVRRQWTLTLFTTSC